MAFFSAAMGGFFDGLYFYMGAFTLAAFTPQAYMLLLVISIALLITCIIVRVHEENMFQRRHILTCIQPKLELSRTACKLLMLELEELLEPASHKEALSESALLDLIKCLNSPLDAALQSTDKVFTNDIAGLKAQAVESSYNALVSEIDTLMQLKQQQKENVKGTWRNAFLAGLFNGLALQGVTASFMFVIGTFCYGTLGCPPVFIMGCLTVGIMAIIGCCVQSMRQYQTYRAAFDTEESELNKEYKVVDEYFTDPKGRLRVGNNQEDLMKIEMLRDILTYIDSMPLEPSLDYMVVEWCEVGRLFLAGLNKGDKASFELFYNFLKRNDELWFMPVVVFVSAICFAIAFVLHYLVKTFASSASNYTDVTAQSNQFFSCRHDDEDSMTNKTLSGGDPSSSGSSSDLTFLSHLKNSDRVFSLVTNDVSTDSKIPSN
jgi:hypothetical protein